MTTVNSEPHTIPIEDVLVGSRIRRDLGDIDELARSIADDGLLHAIVVRPDGLLFAGQRRLAACKKLGWENIPVRVVDLEQIARGEFAENAYHRNKAFPPIRNLYNLASVGTNREGRVPGKTKGNAVRQRCGKIARTRQGQDSRQDRQVRRHFRAHRG